VNKPERTKLQVPIDVNVLQKLQARADNFGFDSVPAYVRFWAKGETSDAIQKSRQIGSNHPNAQALRYIELVMALNHQTPTSTQQALNFVVRQIKRVSFEQAFKGLSQGRTSDTIYDT
jgi:hypothetical protein